MCIKTAKSASNCVDQDQTLHCAASVLALHRLHRSVCSNTQGKNDTLHAFCEIYFPAEYRYYGVVVGSEPAGLVVWGEAGGLVGTVVVALVVRFLKSSTPASHKLYKRSEKKNRKTCF